MVAVFRRPQPTAPLYLLDGPPPVGLPDYRVVFVPAEDAATLPSPLTLAQTWREHPGRYAFCPAPPRSSARFVDALERFAADPAHASARLVWIDDPDQHPSRWSASWLPITGQPDDATTPALATVTFRNIAVWIPAGCSVTLDEAADTLVLTPPAGRSAYLTCADGAEALTSTGPAVTVSFATAEAGCLRMSLTADNTGHEHRPDVDRLDLGIRYFTPATTGTGPATTALPGHRVATCRFPLLHPAPATLPLRAELDPLHPTVPTRTRFDLAAGTVLPSALLTTTGQAVSLTAGADPAHPSGFALQVRALSVPSRPTDPYYLVPTGAFTLSGAPTTGPVRLMCGTSGVEYLTLPGLAGSTICFAAGLPAYAPGTGSDAVTADALTAWAYVTGPRGAGAVYHAQPDDATLYSPAVAAVADDTTAPLLTYHELDGIALPGTVDLAGPIPTLFPLAAFAGLRGAADLALDLERRAVNPARHAAVTAIARRAGTWATAPAGRGSTTTVATTPQGLLASFTDGRMSLTLGQSANGRHRLVLGDLQPELAQACQASQLFLVAADRAALAALATPGGDLTIPAAGSGTWRFDVFADRWGELGTTLILKFADGPLLHLLDDPARWAMGDRLNGGPRTLAATRERLVALVRDAMARADAGSRDFAPFAALARDPAWSGILVVNCAVPVDALPPQVSGIAAGIDTGRFRAHHLGVTVTPVRADAATLTPQDSSLFGLLAYDDPGDVGGTTDDFRFKVTDLTVRFANSAVVSFASTVTLAVNRLFGDEVTRADDGTSGGVVLRGTYQQQGPSGNYIFATSGEVVFHADHSAVLDSVRIASAQFVTLVATGGTATKARCRFLLAGDVRFAALDPDLFSYGGPGGALGFTGLAVDVGFDPADPAASSVYSLDASRMVLDGGSTPRAGSLFDGLPLVPAGMVQAVAPAPGTQATTLATLGYLPVDTALPPGSLPPAWFGLVADLDLGTAGALAAQAGFKASLLIAWAPGGEAAVVVGLKLPGSGPAAQLLSLEDVVKLKVASVTLARESSTYVLSLRDIKLSVLSLTFPPSGQTELLLFSDATSRAGNTLGWYAGYARKPPRRQLSAAQARSEVPHEAGH